MTGVRLFPIVLVLTATRPFAQNPAKPAPPVDAPAQATKTFEVPATLPEFFGAPAASTSVKPLEFEGVIPGELFLLKVGMKESEIREARQYPGKMISEIQLPEGCFFNKLHFGNEIIGNGGPGTATRATYISFSSYNGTPPTRESVKKVAGLFYKTLGHPTKFIQSAARKSLIIEWDSATHTVTHAFEKYSTAEPVANLRIKDKKLCTATWGFGQPKDLVESKPPAGLAGFRSFFEKWHATFLTEKEEKWALEQYARIQAAAKERAAREKTEPDTTPKSTTRTVGGGTGEASATVKVELRKKPEADKYQPAEKPGAENGKTELKPAEPKP